MLHLKTLLVSDPESSVSALMATDVVTFRGTDDTGEAAQAFERYDLVSAPVIDMHNKLISRLTVDMMVDVIREESESESTESGRPARRRRHVLVGVEIGAEPLAMGCAEPVHRIHRLARHRRV